MHLHIKPWFSLLITSLGILVTFTGCEETVEPPKPRTAMRIPVRIGWQIPLATQGQIVQVLKRTNLLETQGLEATFTAFSYGGPQTEAALAGELDVIFVGDQPIINLIARGGKWKIVSRLFYTRTAVMVPPRSPVQKMGDLRGRTVATPFGTVAHREATMKQLAAGLDPDKDVKNINIDILEISNLVQTGGKQSWGKVDAVGVWEPTTSLFELNNLARVVDFTPTLGVIAASDEFITKHSQALVQFLVATLYAWDHFASHTDEVNRWYIEDAKLGYTPEILASAARVEPNYTAASLADIDLGLSEDQIATLETGALWSYERGFSKSQGDMRASVDLSFLSKAMSYTTKKSSNINKGDIRP